jgi:hypothetical protein
MTYYCADPAQLCECSGFAQCEECKAESFYIPPHPAGTVKLLRERGHAVTIRKNKHGSLRYRIDNARELQAIEMDRFYARHYGN